MNSEITICFFAFPASVHSVLLLPYFTLLTLIQSSCLDSLPLILQNIVTVIDLLTTADATYDVEKQRDSNISGDDAFARLYSFVESDIKAAHQLSNLFSFFP
ncbi:syntaxin-72-like isoform X2 [Amaranthus tricolor]|uniref:syntaxin-72-like isoform X2 n=1 Tax=Amaranthus tricolor TaxID=29722 RepID=UPI00258AE0C7|nr:syntaxin-72-like isoform X2 [Amaranthus tricolor]